MRNVFLPENGGRGDESHGGHLIERDSCGPMNACVVKRSGRQCSLGGEVHMMREKERFHCGWGEVRRQDQRGLENKY